MVTDCYKRYCDAKNVPFHTIDLVNSWDDTTLFCPAGMQQFKHLFLDTDHIGTLANNQHCLRIDDLDRLGDGTHFANFHMLGLFSFRTLSVKEAIDFWLEFMATLGLKIDEAHIHPDKLIEWSKFYPNEITVISDATCEWTDGKIGGYCTEFYIDGAEVGNIVNPLGTCIDVGFGAERLERLVYPNQPALSQEDLLIKAVQSIVDAGYIPSNKRQGYVLRKLLRRLRHLNRTDIPFLVEEQDRQRILRCKYDRLKHKFSEKPPEWWFDVHGIDINEMIGGENE